MNGTTPNYTPSPEDPKVNKTTKKIRTFGLDEINWGRILFLIIVLFLLRIVWAIIEGITWGCVESTQTFFDWFTNATIHPGDRIGFANFCKLFLSAVFIYLMIILFNQKGKK